MIEIISYCLELLNSLIYSIYLLGNLKCERVFIHYDA